MESGGGAAKPRNSKDRQPPPEARTGKEGSFATVRESKSLLAPGFRTSGLRNCKRINVLV